MAERFDDDLADDDDDFVEIEQPGKLSSTGWAIGVCTLSAMAMIGMIIGFSMGSNKPEVAAKPNTPATKPVEVALNNPPVNPEPTPVEPTPKPEPKKVEPPKKDPPKKDPPKKVDPPPKKTEEPPPVKQVSFMKEIFPIFQDRCFECHQPGLMKGGLDLKTLAAIEKGGDNGKSVVPGKLAESLLWKTIDDGEMPPAGKKPLTEAEKKLIKEWILAGAK